MRVLTYSLVFCLLIVQEVLTQRFTDFDPRDEGLFLPKQLFQKNFNHPNSFSSSLTMSDTTSTPAWIRYYGESLGRGEDVATAMTIDTYGNTYVTGRSMDYSSFDYATVKYDSTGKEVWVARYDGEARKDDIPTSITVDHYGNVYVTGYSFGNTGTYDYATVKYNQDGIEQWVARYNGTGNSHDTARAIGVDSSGNVYVSGNSYDSTSKSDYVTIKYDANGVVQWVNRFNGTANNYDGVRAMVVEVTGTVYVTGRSLTIGSSYDFVTVKYNSDGTQEWIARYDGNSHYFDFPNAIAIDDIGNVYVTGQSSVLTQSFDFATIKYNAEGVQQWVATYSMKSGLYADIAVDIAVDQQYNVYVSGRCEDTTDINDIVTIKYDVNGNQVWTARYNSGRNKDDYPNKIAVTPNGNVIVAGYTSGYGGIIIKYDSLGVQQWVSKVSTNAIIRSIRIGQEENVYLSTSVYRFHTNWNFSTQKCDSSGQKLWESEYDGPGSYYAEAKLMAKGTNDNLYVVGRQYSRFDNHYRWEMVTLKYNFQGDLIWTQKFREAMNIWPSSIALDSKEDIYICVSVWDTLLVRSVLIKYNPNGELLWRVMFPLNGLRMVLDQYDNLFVAANKIDSLYHRNIVLSKVLTNGDIAWEVTYSNPQGFNNYLSGIAIDNEGKVIIVNNIHTSDSAATVEVIKYTNDGKIVWVSQFSDSNVISFSLTPKVDKWNNIIVAGTSLSHNSSLDFLTLKYSKDGEFLWAQVYSSRDNLADEVVGFTIDSSGTTYVVGNTESLTPRGILDQDIVLIKYNSDGFVEWENHFAGPDGSYDKASDMKIDSRGNIYILGVSDKVLIMLAYDENGILRGNTKYYPDQYGYHYPEFLLLGSDSELFVTGTTWFSGYSVNKIFTMKYHPLPLLVTDEDRTFPLQFALAQNYPNPFNPTTYIRYALPHKQFVSLKIYNILGQEVKTLFEGLQDAGAHVAEFNASHLSSGVYFYRIVTSSGFIHTRKMLLLR